MRGCDTGRRPAAAAGDQLSASPPEATRRTEPLWLQPCPDALLDDLPDAAPGPEARYETKEAVALAFVAGLQRLPLRQRAVLVPRDVLGYPAAQAARMPGVSEVPVNSALQRARATLTAQLPAAGIDRAVQSARPTAPPARLRALSVMARRSSPCPGRAWRAGPGRMRAAGPARSLDAGLLCAETV